MILSCATAPSEAPGLAGTPDGHYGISLLGEPLLNPSFDQSQRIELESKLESARVAFQAQPDNEDALIWYGRRLAYLGRYSEAIAVYTEGLEAFPQSERIRRHRGHRYITIRKLDAAIRDFEAAVAIMKNKENRIEEDGLPNAMNKPIGTTQGNIWYHLGLARYLKGDYEGALQAYTKRGELTDRNDDNRVSTAYWRHIILARLGRRTEAATALMGISNKMNVIENHSYWDLALLFKGEKKVTDLQKRSDEVHDQSVLSATVEYGISIYKQLRGDLPGAISHWQSMVESSQATTAFGYIAAESNLAQLRRLANNEP